MHLNEPNKSAAPTWGVVTRAYTVESPPLRLTGCLSCSGFSQPCAVCIPHYFIVASDPFSVVQCQLFIIHCEF